MDKHGKEILTGEYRHALDGKRRLFIPSRLRRIKNFVLTRGLEGCVAIYPENEWMRLSEKLNMMPVKNKTQARAFKRLFVSGAIITETDSQGRILIPETLEDYAKIKKEVMIIGVENHIEVWAIEKWKSYKKVAEKAFKEVAEQIEI